MQPPLLLLACVILATGAVAVGCGDDEEAATSSESLLAFVWNESGESADGGGSQPSLQIYVSNSDGTDIRALTSGPGAAQWPTWSPDGRHLAFVWVDPAGTSDVFVVSGDGTGLTNLTNDAASEGGVAWTPDGERVTYVSDRAGNQEIFVVGRDGTGHVNITNSSRADWFELTFFGVGNVPNPWSPDGSRLAFSRSTETDPETGLPVGQQVWVADADGSNQRPVGPDPGAFAGWAPDGNSVLVIDFGDATGGSYILVNVDGDEETVIYTLEAIGDAPPQGFPVLSPDGTRLVFTRTDPTDGQDRLYLVNMDGSGLRRVTTGSGPGCEGLFGTSWSADGSQIAFTRDCWDGDSEVWVVEVSTGDEIHVAGTSQARPTQAALYPAWSPADGR